MPGLIEEVLSGVEWCGANTTAYAVYWAYACVPGLAGAAEWILQGVVCEYEHAVEYVRLLGERTFS